MEIQYQRNHKNSYMVLIDDTPELSMDGNLAEHMMKNQKIEGLLSFVTMEHDEKMTYWYTITGCQSISDWLKFHRLDYKLIKKIMLSLMAVLDRLPNYYLRPEHMYLDLNQIYMDQAGEYLKFTYAPAIDKSINDSITGLLEQFLPLIDHKDTDAVKLGYGLYEKSREENASIWEYLEDDRNLPRESMNNFRVNSLEKSEFEDNTFKSMSDKDHYDFSDKKIENDSKAEGRKLDTNKKAEAGRKLDMNKKAEAGRKTETNKKTEGEWDFLTKAFFKKKEDEPVVMPLVIEPEEAMEVEIKPTEFIAEGGIILGKLKYDGSGNQLDMPIDCDEFLIGCRNPKANGQIMAPSVSRNHARVTREGDSYFLEDLNSRNGTFVNDRQLQYKQRVKLAVGDRVRFSSEEYRFY